MTSPLTLELLPACFSVARLPAGTRPPHAPPAAAFWSLTVTEAEVSVVCEEGDEPPDARIERGWRALRVVGQLDFSLVGVVRDFSAVLAGANVSVFVVSTFDTDYVLVKQDQLASACTALQRAGYAVIAGP